MLPNQIIIYKGFTFKIVKTLSTGHCAECKVVQLRQFQQLTKLAQISSPKFYEGPYDQERDVMENWEDFLNK